MKITIDTRIKNVKCGPPEVIYVPEYITEKACKIMLSVFRILRALNWELVEYSKATFATSINSRLVFNFLIVLDTVKFIGFKIKFLVTWEENTTKIFFGISKNEEENYISLPENLEFDDKLLEQERIFTLTKSIVDALQIAIESKLKNLACNMDVLKSKIIR